MKNIKKIIGAFILLLAFQKIPSGYAANNDTARLPGNEVIYYGEPNEDTNNLEIAGINLSVYDYVEVQYYAIINSKTLFVSGQKGSDSIVLASIALDTQKLTVIAEYPFEGHWPTKSIQWTVFIMPQLDPPNVYVLVTYTKDDSGMRVTYTSTQIEVFRLEADGQYSSINTEECDETNTSIEENTDPQFIYKHIAAIDVAYATGVSNLPTTAIQPATMNTTTVFLGYLNQDGYPDILVWREIYLSKKIADPGEDDYVFDHEELQVMCFNPDERNFAAFTRFSSTQPAGE